MGVKITPEGIFANGDLVSKHTRYLRLEDTNLNDVLQRGEYWESDSVNFSKANNYPVGDEDVYEACKLTVDTIGDTGHVIQEVVYTGYHFSTYARSTLNNGNTWSEWKLIQTSPTTKGIGLHDEDFDEYILSFQFWDEDANSCDINVKDAYIKFIPAGNALHITGMIKVQDFEADPGDESFILDIDLKKLIVNNFNPRYGKLKSYTWGTATGSLYGGNDFADYDNGEFPFRCEARRTDDGDGATLRFYTNDGLFREWDTSGGVIRSMVLTFAITVLIDTGGL